MKLTNEQKLQLIDALNQIKAGHRPYSLMGICGNLTTIITGDNRDLEEFCCYAFVEIYSKDWPKHSGHPTFPVPYGDCAVWENPLRLELVDYLLEQLHG